VLPFGHISDDLKCLLDTLVRDLRTSFELGIVGIPVEA
jgi:hypothetical protein